MVVVCAIGIMHYNNPACNDIPCAAKDAERVYSTFRNVLGGDFSDSRSVCLSDLTRQQFETIIDAIQITLNADDTFVLYFSGHGEITKNSGFNLLFNDNSCSLARISDMFANSNCKVVLILDCCQAGGATPFASSIRESKQLCVLASCGDFESSEYTASESEFTSYLCRALYSLSAEGECISLISISEKITHMGYFKAIVNIGASSNGDLVLIEKNILLSTYDDFPQRFLQQLEASSALLRESLWYSLADVPDSIIKRICKEYFRCFNPNTIFYPEDSWLIRRAIGSIIAQLDDCKEIVEALIQSLFWQEQCIGIIGARYLFETDSELYNFLSKQIEEKTIKETDPLWLSNLYMSENLGYDCGLFLNTDLGKTAWGIIEIFKTVKGIDFPHYTSMLENLNIPRDVISKFSSYASFGNNDRNKLFSVLAMQTRRGRLPPKVKSKFLLSALYGTWRGYIDLNLKDYMETTSARQISQELEVASCIPDIDYKMAIFDFFAHNLELMRNYSSVLEWGLHDEHPRVRTSALKAYKAIEYPDNILFASITENISTILPGIFDLFLECPDTHRDSLIEFLKSSNEFNVGDINCLKYSWRNN